MKTVKLFNDFVLEKEANTKEDDDNAKILYYFEDNKYRSVTKGEIIGESGGFVKLLVGRTEIEQWIGCVCQTFDQAKRLKKILDKHEWWDIGPGDMKPAELKELKDKIIKERNDKNISEVKK